MKPRISIPPKKAGVKRSTKSLPRIIYVVELDPAVADFPAFALENPRYVPGKACFYVGSTTLTAEERFNNHLVGLQCSEIVRRFGRSLRMDLVPPQKPILREWALENEQRRAQDFRSQGFGAYQK